MRDVLRGNSLAGIPSVVYGCSAKTLSGIVKSDDFLSTAVKLSGERNSHVLLLSGVLETEAVVVHRGYWK